MTGSTNWTSTKMALKEQDSVDKNLTHCIYAMEVIHRDPSEDSESEDYEFEEQESQLWTETWKQFWIVSNI